MTSVFLITRLPVGTSVPWYLTSFASGTKIVNGARDPNPNTESWLHYFVTRLPAQRIFTLSNAPLPFLSLLPSFPYHFKQTTVALYHKAFYPRLRETLN